MIELLSDILIIICLALLLSVQYGMYIADIKQNRNKGWEIVVGAIPFAPYILMILTGLWHIIHLLFLRK